MEVKRSALAAEGILCSAVAESGGHQSIELRYPASGVFPTRASAALVAWWLSLVSLTAKTNGFLVWSRYHQLWDNVWRRCLFGAREDVYTTLGFVVELS
jgi:hypothetical protein